MAPTPARGALDPQPGVDYAGVLREPGTASTANLATVRALLGIVVAFALYLVVVPLVTQLLTGIGWLVAGRPGNFQLYYREALGFLHPSGLVASNLGLAMLVPITLVVARVAHGRAPRWLASVQPGMRWRYLVLCLPVAAVVLNAVLLLGRMGQPWNPQPQAHLWTWLLLVLLTSPLQAAAEEFFFRGYLLQAFGALASRADLTGEAAENAERLARWFAVVASAVVFALMHGVQNPALFADRLGFGLLAGALVLLTGGLEAGIACHVANNVFAFGWAAFFGGIAQTRALQSIGWASAAADLASFALFGAVAWWVARRMHLAVRTPAVAGRDDLPQSRTIQ